MFFRNDAQAAAVCSRLMGFVGLADYWRGPHLAGCAEEPRMSPLALSDYQAGGGALSSGQWVMLRLCHDLWAGGSETSLVDVVRHAPSVTPVVASLMTALGNADAVDGWLAEFCPCPDCDPVPGVRRYTAN